MAQQNVNVKSAPTKPTTASAQLKKDEIHSVCRSVESVLAAQLTADQLHDVYRFVMENGRDTGLDLPELPEDAEEFVFAEPESPDSYSVWMLRGYPIAASDNLSMINKVIGG